ncbi:DUF4190 domain-containing protein [Clostridium cellulovorans]|uniref:DUF4190 domain-containing protein n=1 Tax=Clostridium cellulovorans (strain ATCC 35296 / DSM 3052 / OCM 3 / 743B) TaxID=573061 RepID=D9SV96_CLOC7|nr:DUF4190 domain-containing protein [Clostridium cellulovorans]ADL53070.1 hypothetical protein Clocel_3391 [Clostridium cellulovorans 743B]
MNFDNNTEITKSKKAIVRNQVSNKNNTLAITSLVFGIISLIFCWAPICPIITGIIGTITGFISVIRKRDGSNMAIIGIVLSVLGILLGIIFFILLNLIVSYK